MIDELVVPSVDSHSDNDVEVAAATSVTSVAGAQSFQWRS